MGGAADLPAVPVEELSTSTPGAPAGTTGDARTPDGWRVPDGRIDAPD
jgi:hypothetical protein